MMMMMLLILIDDAVGDDDNDDVAVEEGLNCGSRWALGINGPRQPVKQCRTQWRKAQIRTMPRTGEHTGEKPNNLDKGRKAEQIH